MDALVGDALRSYSRYWLETFRLPKMDKREVAERVDANTIGAEHLDAALDAGQGRDPRPAAHGQLGRRRASGWSQHTGPFATVAERLKPESLFDRFVEYRESLGLEILPLTGGARPPLEVLRERLRENKVVCLLADRDLSRNGIEVDFFGEPTRMPGGPAAARRDDRRRPAAGGAVVHRRTGWGQRDQPGRSTSPRAGCATRCPRLTQALRRRVRRSTSPTHPADWHMLQRLWLADLPPRPADRTKLADVDAHRHRLPVLLGHPRRRAGARPRPGRAADRARPPRLGARARATRTSPGLPPYVVMAGKAVPIPYNGSVARLQFGVVSRGAGAALAARRRVRRGARARAGAAEPVAADLHDPRRADGRDLPRGHRPLAVPGDVRHRAAAVPREARRAGSRCRRRRAR